MKILIEISPGELVDRLTILRIKMARLKDEEKRNVVHEEYRELMAVYLTEVPQDNPIVHRCSECLLDVNNRLWEHETIVREANEGGFNHITSAKIIPQYNDLRAAYKKMINDTLGATGEVKSHVLPDVRGVP